MHTEDYIHINKKSWNNRTDEHYQSDFYDVKGFLEGKSSLNDIELSLLGDVENKHILHLQCHFGQDTLSLSRLGAMTTGIDLSDNAIKTAQELAEKANLNARFICTDVYDTPKHIDEKFDIVYTSYGTIGWLPDLNKWAEVVSHFLKPGGEFVFVEFHPVVWMFDDNFENIAYHYFKNEPIIETVTGSYAAKNSESNFETISWNHGLAEVFSSLLDHGLQITSFQEFDYSPYDCFNKTIEIAPKKYRIEHLGNKIPMVYALKAIKR